MKVVIVGGGIAGVSACLAVRNEQPDAEIILLEKAQEVGYIPSSLSLLLKEEVKELNDLRLYNQCELEKNFKVDVRTATECFGLDDEHHLIVNNEEKLFFDYLIIATGSDQFSSKFSLENSQKIYTFKHQMEAKQLLDDLEGLEKIAVIGAGQVGMEITEGLLKQNKTVSLFETQSYPLFRYIEKDLGQLFIDKLQQQVTTHFRESIVGLKEEDEGVLLTSNKATYHFDAALLAVNTRPETSRWQNYLQLNDDNTIKVNEYLQTSMAHIFAIGDVIQSEFSPLARPVYSALASNAIRTAQVVAKNLGMEKIRDVGTTRVSGNHLFGLYLAQAGLLEKETVFYPREVKIVPYQENDGEDWTFTKLIYDAFFGDLLGAFFISTQDVEQSINEFVKKIVPVDEEIFSEQVFIPYNMAIEQREESHEN